MKAVLIQLPFHLMARSVLTGSWDKTARLWEIKKTHKEFQTENSYQDLSISQKIKYGILK